MRVTLCDRCLKKIGRYVANVDLTVHYPIATPDSDIHLCMDCWNEFEKFINDEQTEADITYKINKQNLAIDPNYNRIRYQNYMLGM